MPENGAGEDILSLTRDLCCYRTGVVADENEALFERIGREVPVELHRFASGSEWNGWVVPDSWRVRRAEIIKDGRKVFDGRVNPLAVGALSRPFCGSISFEELKKHVVTDPDQPGAYVFHCQWQYRPWAADWAFCVPYEIYQTLEPGDYEVRLETETMPGEMLVGVSRLAGASDRTIVFNAHTCHPHMANDGFAGVATLIRLLQWLRERRTRYSYELVMAPEHIGTIFYLRDRSSAEIERMVGGVFAEMPGNDGPVKVASTFLGEQAVDLAFRGAARHHAERHVLAPWRLSAGNDETVWEAPGYEVPFVQINRSLHYLSHFPGYHTNLDTPDSLEPVMLSEFFGVMQKAVQALEDDAVLFRTFDGLISLANPRYDLYLERPDPAMVKDLEGDSEKWGRLLDFLFRYMDGSISILEIAARHDLPFDRLFGYLKRFEEKGLVRMRPRMIQRRAQSKRFAATHEEPLDGAKGGAP
jgi:aminopeptidase-like protein